MKSRISVFPRGQRTQKFVWLAAVAGLFLARCGEQAPAFTEQSAAADSGDQVTADNFYGDNIPNADSSTVTGTVTGTVTSNGGAEIFTSWRPGDPLITTTTDSGSEPFANLELVTDTSVSRTNSKVDILWIVDSSGSMREEQSYLGQNFSSFISRLALTNSDFQVGVTTTDVCASGSPLLVPVASRYCPTLDGQASSHLRGSLVGNAGSKVLKPTMSDLQTKFLSYANVGINGSSFEHGLTAAKMAVQKSQAGQNEGLIRPGAFLAVIVVSDEEDDGIGLGTTDSYTGQNYIQAGLTNYHYNSDDFIQDARAIKGAGNFSVSTITGTRNADGRMCTSPHSQPLEEGTQYISAAKKTGGIIQSICDSNWSTSLASIGQDIAAQSSQVVLTKTPYASSIKVFVNGIQSSNWSYNGGNNAVKFDSGNIPATGSSVTIQYYAAP